MSSSSVTLSVEEAQEQLWEMLCGMKRQDVKSFIGWMQSHFTPDVLNDLEQKSHRFECQEKMMEIAKHIKQRMPKDGLGVMPSEKIRYPTSGRDKELNKTNTLHVDCFLYDDDDLEELVDDGKINRTYCADCGSHNTRKMTFISHSLAQHQLDFMFTDLVPLAEQKEGFKVLDIGSRLGAVVFAATIYGRNKVLVTGIEKNEELCKLQESVIHEFGLNGVEIVNNDVRQEEQRLREADMVIMNNVFSFFLDPEEQAACWETVHSCLKEGAILIHHPSVKKVTSHLKLSFDVDDWLHKNFTVPECTRKALNNKDLFEDFSNLVKYTVKPKMKSEEAKKPLVG